MEQFEGFVGGKEFGIEKFISYLYLLFAPMFHQINSYEKTMDVMYFISNHG